MSREELKLYVIHLKNISDYRGITGLLFYTSTTLMIKPKETGFLDRKLQSTSM